MTSTETLAPNYSVYPRLAGFAVNDGRFVVERIRPTYWTAHGTLRAVGESRVLGVFDTREEAEAAVVADGPVWAAEAHVDRPLN